MISTYLCQNLREIEKNTELGFETTSIILFCTFLYTLKHYILNVKKTFFVKLINFEGFGNQIVVLLTKNCLIIIN